MNIAGGGWVRCEAILAKRAEYLPREEERPKQVCEELPGFLLRCKMMGEAVLQRVSEDKVLIR